MTAKDQFLLTPHAEKWRIILSNDCVREAFNYALLEMAERMPGAVDPAKGWDCHSQMQGAIKLRQLLETLAEPYKETKADTSNKLRHDAYDNPRRAGY